MAQNDVVFPVGYREGETVTTPAGTFTVGPGRKTKLSDAQLKHFRDTSGPDFFRHDDQEPTDAERAEIEARSSDPGLKTVQHPAQKPNEEYEHAAAAREAVGKLISRAIPELLSRLQVTALKNLEEGITLDDVSTLEDAQQVATATIEIPLGGGKVLRASAQSSALREIARRTVAQDHLERTGDARPLEATSDTVDTGADKQPPDDNR